MERKFDKEVITALYRSGARKLATEYARDRGLRIVLGPIKKPKIPYADGSKRVMAAAGIQIHDVDFSSGQEPDGYDDNFATTMMVNFTLTEPLLSKMLGVQSRVLDRRLAELKSGKMKANVVTKLFDSKVGESVLKALRPKIIGLLVDHLGRNVRVGPREIGWDVGSDWQKYEVKGNGIVFEVEVEVDARLA